MTPAPERPDTPTARLRAALDALHPSARYVRVEAIDLAASLAAAPVALREADFPKPPPLDWESAPERPDHALHFDPDCEECVYLARPTVIHAAVTDARLDVERLARAMIRVLVPTLDHGDIDIAAPAIAAEYAALSRQEKETA